MQLVPEKVLLCRTGSLALLLLLQGTLHTALVAAEANLEALSPPAARLSSSTWCNPQPFPGITNQLPT